MPKKRHRAPDQLVELVRFGLSIICEEGNRPRDTANKEFAKELPQLKKDLACLVQKQPPVLQRPVDVTVQVSPIGEGRSQLNIAPKTGDAKNHRQLGRLTPLLIWNDEDLWARFKQCKHCGRFYVGETKAEADYCPPLKPGEKRRDLRCKQRCQYLDCHPPYRTKRKRKRSKKPSKQ